MKTLKLAVALSALPLVAAKSPMHSHPDTLLVPLADGKARFTMPDGKTQDVVLTKENASYNPAFTHSPANVGTNKVVAIP
jgi:hypothetical protein